MQAVQRFDNVGAVSLVVPEEVFALRQFFLGPDGGEYLFAGIGVDAGVIDLGGEGHGGRGEVLDLLKVHVELLGLGGKFGHVYLAACGMARYEVGNELLAHAVALIYGIEDSLEVVEQREIGFTHHIEHVGTCVFGRHFQSSRNVIGYKLLVVASVYGINLMIAGGVHRKVVAHTAADKRFLYFGHGINRVVYVEQPGMVGIEIRARLGVKARRPHAFLAYREVVSMHAVHVGRRAAKVADIAFEVVHTGHLTHLLEYGFLAARCYEFALMCRYCAESASAETSAVHVDRMTYHFVGRNHFAFVAWMRHAGVRKVKGAVNLGRTHRWKHGIDLDHALPMLLPKSVALKSVALLLDVLEILSLTAFVGHTLLK